MIISRIEAEGYRCLRHIGQDLGPFQMLVGPNGSGKSVFLDLIVFLGDLLTVGLTEAMAKRTFSYGDLVSKGSDGFRLAVEGGPDPRDGSNAKSGLGRIRYEVEARIDSQHESFGITVERLMAVEDSGKRVPLLTAEEGPQFGGHDLTLPGFGPPILLRDHSVLATSRLEIGAGGRELYRLLTGRCSTVCFDNTLLRLPSPRAVNSQSVIDGSEIGRLAGQLRKLHPDSFQSWIRHLRAVIPDLADIQVRFQDELDGAWIIGETTSEGPAAISIRHTDGGEEEQARMSDGTLRLLALTLLMYVPDSRRVYLIEEPEVGLYPTAIETMMQSLTSAYDAQVLITTHSPLVVGLSRPDQLLCFQKSGDGTEITPGNRHPMLSEWHSGLDISDWFSAGVLG